MAFKGGDSEVPEEQQWTIAGKTLQSRLFLGTARYPSLALLNRALEAARADVITLSMRRLMPGEPGILEGLEGSHYTLLPNTAGCYTAKEAVLCAHLAREALGTSWIKLEVMGDERTLYPNTPLLLEVAEELVREGFDVFPYCTDDPFICSRLEKIGCAAVMPLAAPIGSGMGVCNPHNLQMIRQGVEVPILVDAGIGAPSDVVQVMELGVDGVLVNTAVAQAEDPVRMAKAMDHAVLAGRQGFLAGRIPRLHAGEKVSEASSPPYRQ